MNSLRRNMLIFSTMILAGTFGVVGYGHAGPAPQEPITLAPSESSSTSVEVGGSTSAPADREYQYKRVYRESREDAVPAETTRSTAVETYSNSDTTTGNPADREYQYKREYRESHRGAVTREPVESGTTESYSRSNTTTTVPGEGVSEYKREYHESHRDAGPPEFGRNGDVESYSRSETTTTVPVVREPAIRERETVVVEREPKVDHSISGWWHRHIHPEH